jgi:hypothetical protein
MDKRGAASAKTLKTLHEIFIDSKNKNKYF